jgi:hypothetical protein
MRSVKTNKIIVLMCAAILLFNVFGCAGFRDLPTETKVVMSYEGMGAVLETSKPILQAFCQDGTINPGDCIEARKAYNEAVSIYKFLGDIALVAIDTGDDSSYTMMVGRLMDLLIKIQEYTGKN